MSEVSSVATYLSGLLAELNREPGIDVELCPGYTSGLQTAETDSVSLKLCQRGDPQRILSLNLVDVYPQGNLQQRQRVKSELRSTLLAFLMAKPPVPSVVKTIVA
jgi:hypothetical protein